MYTCPGLSIAFWVVFCLLFVDLVVLYGNLPGDTGMSFDSDGGFISGWPALLATLVVFQIALNL